MLRRGNSRGDFMQKTAGVAGATLGARSTILGAQPLMASPKPVPLSDRVRFGIVAKTLKT